MSFGLLGKKLSHSASKEIHSCFGNYDYRLFEKKEDELDCFFEDKSISGFNVTIPYKIEAFNRCDLLSPIAKLTGNVNTVLRKDNRLVGYNTDYIGFEKMCKKNQVDFQNKKVIVLGSGGASKTIQVYCKNESAREVIVISRNGENNYENIIKHNDADIIINATPVGMFPDNYSSPVDLNEFNNCECVIDLIYNPFNTMLLQSAAEKGVKAINGIEMLVYQAAQSSEIFTGKKVSIEKQEETVKYISKKNRNIVFIGMPGCGKSTKAEKLAKEMSREWIDTDDEIAKLYDTPENLINSLGEKRFREIESEIVLNVMKNCGKVISVGGGAVLSKENRCAIKSNSVVYFIDKPLNQLETTGRPLSSSPEKLKRIYEERKNIYESLSDKIVN